MSSAWDPDFSSRSPMFAPLHEAAAELARERWPEPNEYQCLAARRNVTNAAGTPVRFVPQGRRPVCFEHGYEPRIFLRGEIQLRPCNWHDLLNALVWLTYPRAKAALNSRQYAALCEQQRRGAPNRGPEQDALTLFDEGGVIVACSDAELADLLVGFEWKRLFWQRRDQVSSRMRFYVFGHALYEKALHPFTGVTGRGLLFDVEPELFAQPLAEQLAVLDALLAARLAAGACLQSTRELSPVPVLGVPGWLADNSVESYYDNVEYFRPGRTPRRA